MNIFHRSEIFGCKTGNCPKRVCVPRLFLHRFARSSKNKRNAKPYLKAKTKNAHTSPLFTKKYRRSAKLHLHTVRCSEAYAAPVLCRNAERCNVGEARCFLQIQFSFWYP